mgnify:CR=1 FL=1
MITIEKDDFTGLKKIHTPIFNFQEFNVFNDLKQMRGTQNLRKSEMKILENEISLTLQRLKDNKGSADAALKLVERVKNSLQNPNFVGDISLLTSKIEELQVIAAVKKAEFSYKIYIYHE